MRVSDDLVFEKKEMRKQKKVEKAEKLVEEEEVDEARQAQVTAEEVVRDNLRMIEEDDDIARREEEWRIAKAQRDERRRLERRERERVEEELRPKTEKLRVFADHNSSALADPAVATVVTKKSLELSSASETSSATGLVRPSRSSHKCPMCVRTFSDIARLHAHIENHH